MKILLNLTIIFILITGCESKFQLQDNYYLYPDDEFGNGYYLMCNPGCSDFESLQYITRLQWNEKYIIVNTVKKGWFVIKARGTELKCCNNDSLIGPMDSIEIEKYITKENINYLIKREYSYNFRNMKEEKKKKYKIH